MASDVRCTCCGADNPATNRFCSSCGQAIQPDDASTPRPTGVRWGCVLSAVLALLLLIGPPSGIAYYFLYHQDRSNDVGTVVPASAGEPLEPIWVDVPMDPAEPLLIAFGLETGPDNIVREIHLLEYASEENDGHVETVLLFLDGADAPVSATFDPSGRPEYLVFPEGEHLFLEYLPQSILAHFRTDEGQFGIQSIPISPDIREWLDLLESGHVARQSDQELPPVQLMSSIVGSLLAAHGVGSGPQQEARFQGTSEVLSVSWQGSGILPLRAQDGQGRTIQGAQFQISCPDVECEHIYESRTRDHTTVHIQHPVVALEVPVSAMQDLPVKTLEACRDDLDRAARRVTHQNTAIAGVITFLAWLMFPKMTLLQTAATFAATAAPGYVFSPGDFQQCIDRAQKAAALHEFESKRALEEPEVFRTVATVEVCVSHELYDFPEPCTRLTYTPYRLSDQFRPGTRLRGDYVVDINRYRRAEHTFSGRLAGQAAEMEVCSPDSPTGRFGAVLLSAGHSSAQFGGASTSMFAPPGYETSCGAGEHTIDSALEAFELHLENAGLSRDAIDLLLPRYHRCLTADAVQDDTYQAILETCRMVIAVGQLLPADPSTTWESAYPGATIENEVFVSWYNVSESNLIGMVYFVVDMPAERFVEQLPVFGYPDSQPADVSGCSMKLLATHALEGEFDSMTGEIQGTVFGSNTPLVVSGRCRLENELQLERQTTLRDMDFGPDDTYEGATWTGYRDGNLVVVEVPFLTGYTVVELQIILD